MSEPARVAWRVVPGDDRVRALSGSGGLRASGRWHTRGHPVVYLASVPSLAMLEVLVNQTAENLLTLEYHLMRVEFPAGTLSTLPLTELPPGWNHPQRVQGTMTLGDAWLEGRSGLVLQVPSALVPLEVEDAEHNYLVNPLHPGSAALRVTQVLPLPFDPRLTR